MKEWIKWLFDYESFHTPENLGDWNSALSQAYEIPSTIITTTCFVTFVTFLIVRTKRKYLIHCIPFSVVMGWFLFSIGLCFLANRLCFNWPMYRLFSLFYIQAGISGIAVLCVTPSVIKSYFSSTEPDKVIEQVTKEKEEIVQQKNLVESHRNELLSDRERIVRLLKLRDDTIEELVSQINKIEAVNQTLTDHTPLNSVIDNLQKLRRANEQGNGGQLHAAQSG